MADENTTIIIKKIKKGGHGHHGGAWKVAYADFVTAMMAFFLLLWLLASTSEGQKEGIAEYFTPTIGLKDSQGIGFDGGEKATKEGKSKSDTAPPGLVLGQVPQGPIPEAPEETIMEGEEEAKLFEKAEKEMKQAIEADPNLREFSENIVVEQTPEGLKLEIRDDDRHPMFLPGSVEISEFGRKIFAALAPFIRKMPNLISIIGHTDATATSNTNYTNWELSADRANSARRFLLTQDLTEKRIGKVTGRADRELLLPDVPTSPRNRRIEIILLKGSHLQQLPQNQVAPRPLLNVPRASDTIQKMERARVKKEMELEVETPKVQEEPAKLSDPGATFPMSSGSTLKPVLRPGGAGSLPAATRDSFIRPQMEVPLNVRPQNQKAITPAAPAIKKQIREEEPVNHGPLPDNTFP